jgi:hypothetical protein
MPASAVPIHNCAICCQPLAGKATVPTTTGGAVHIHCADQEALAAAHGRTLAALVSGALLVAGSWELGTRQWELVATLALLIALHVQFNRRWWQEAARRVLGIHGRRPVDFRRVASQSFSQRNCSAATRRKSTGWHEPSGGDT